MFLYPDPEFLSRLLPAYYSSPGTQPPVIRQLVCFIKNPEQTQHTITNLEILDNLLPFSLSTEMDYNIYYYYNNNGYEYFKNIIFPYYIILSQKIIMLSWDLQDTFICQEQEYVEFYRKRFDSIISASKKLVISMSEPKDILEHLQFERKGGEQDCFLEYEPCLCMYADRELIDRLIKPQLPNREEMLESILRRVDCLKNLQQPAFIFSQKGLEFFMETGITTDFPQGFAAPAPPKDRLELLKRIRDICAQDLQTIRMVNQELFFLPEFVSITVSEYEGVDFLLYDKKNGFRYLYITESTLSRSFKNFLMDLVETDLVHSKEETLEILDAFVGRYEAAEKGNAEEQD